MLWCIIGVYETAHSIDCDNPHQEEAAPVEGNYDEVPLRPSLPRQAKNKRD